MLRHLFLTLSLLISSFTVFAQFGPEHTLVHQGSYGTSGVYATDVDGDGDADPISISVNDSQIAWYENTGDGHFGLSRIIAADAAGVIAIISADLDADGDQDMVYASTDDDMIAWYENEGSGNFSARHIICDTADGATDVFIADLNNDGEPDILSTSRNDNKVAWYPNTGNGTFGPQQIISNTASGALALTAKDFNMDGLTDVVAVAANSNNVGWYRNLGNGVFTAITIISTQVDGLVDVAADDIDGDGLTDIISASVNDHKIAWYKNLGNGTFGTQNLVSEQIYNIQSIYIAAVDDNSTKDILAVGTPFVNPNNIFLQYCRNLGGTFYWDPAYLLEGENYYTNTVFASDLDNDGDEDVLFSTNIPERDQIGWIENDENVGFPDARSISDPLQRPTDLSTADLNGDGTQDIVAVSELGGQVTWYPNLGSGTFGSQQVIAYDLTWWNNVLEVADLDMDGDQDVITSTDYQIVWFENDGAGNFDTLQAIGIWDPAQFTDVHTTDLDGDGDPEIFVSDYDADMIGWYDNLGGGNFGPLNTVTTTADQVNTFCLMDVDGDGLKDVIAGFFYIVSVYKNLGNGSFGPQQTIGSFEGGFNEVAVGDIDNDGDADISAGGYLRAVWFENNGTTSYWPEHLVNDAHSTYYTLSLTDFDLDGDLDIFSGAGTPGGQTPGPGSQFLFLHENQGGGNFGPEQLLDSNSYGVYMADMDNDTDAELVLYGKHRIGLKENYFIHSTTAGGRLFADMNQNNLFDAGDFPLQYAGVLSNPENAFSYTFVDGTYAVSFDETVTDYELFPQDMAHWTVTTDSLSYHLAIDSLPGNAGNLDFGFYPTEFSHELKSELTGGYPRCNTTVNYWLTVRNTGSTLPSGTIHLQLDSSITYVGATTNPAAVNGQDIYWHYDSLAYFSGQQIKIKVLLPDFNSMGDELQSLLTVTADSSGTELFSYTDTLNQLLVCAYDPNDKSAVPAGEGLAGHIPMSTEWIDYTVRFQNTGNDTAITVIIRDLIDLHLNGSSFQLLASSHPVHISSDENGLMSFKFNNIMLPDSTTNEAGSHGFISYRVQLRDGIPVGSEIENTAFIYFDQNPAVITNTTVHTLSSALAIEELNNNGFIIFPNPFKDGFTIKLTDNITGNYDVAVLSITGDQVFAKKGLTDTNQYIELPAIPRGIYFVRVTDTETGAFMTGKIAAE